MNLVSSGIIFIPRGSLTETRVRVSGAGAGGGKC